MANWSKKDYYQASESEDEEEVAREKLKETAELLKESDLFPEFEQEELNYHQLTEDELLEVIERDSPELIGMLGTVKKLVNVIKAAKKSKDTTVMEYCKILAAHISYYLFLKARGKIAANHPVIQSVKNLERIISNKINTSADIEEKVEKTERKVEKVQEKTKEDEKSERRREVDERIKKNKGIVKKRKKLERNVRVKNKMKYLKKIKIRRSTLGIAEPRNQERYDGEMTGIRKNLVKSVKLT